MDVDLIFKIAAVGILVAVLNQLLVRSGREEQAMMTTLAGLVVVMMILVREISGLFQLIKTMLRSDKERYRHEIIRTLFTTAFYIITEINQREQPGEIKQGRCEVLFDEFMSLLQQYNKRERNVSFYAKQLNITPKYLSSVVKEVSGKTAARWIDESVILEAKALLKYSGMSIQEIAYHLNFSTQSFFGKYFKQHTGTSPSRYKRKG